MRNTLLWKRCLGRMLSFFYFIPRTRKIILIYHAVGRGPWAISEEVFQKQIEWLSKHCVILPLNELLSNSLGDQKIKNLRDEIPEIIDGMKNSFFKDLRDYVLKHGACALKPVQVALTFDDGYACLYDTVLPILNSVGAVGTVYLNTGWINQESRRASCHELGHYPEEHFLTWNEVSVLQKAGWEIGSHGVEHVDLTKQSSDIVRKELRDSKKKIEQKIKKRCNHFAYTFGRHSELVRDAVSEANYHYAVAGHHQPLSKKDDNVSLPRLNIESSYSMNDFQNIVLGKWDFIGHVHRVKQWIKRR